MNAGEMGESNLCFCRALVWCDYFLLGALSLLLYFFCVVRRKILPMLDELRTWFDTELPLVADAIPLHILYEDLHIASPLPKVPTTLRSVGGSHAQ